MQETLIQYTSCVSQKPEDTVQDKWSNLKARLQLRESYIQEPYESAVRLFNGPLEGQADWVIDLYGRSIVLHHYHKDALALEDDLANLQSLVQKLYPFVTCIILKERRAKEASLRQGSMLFGERSDTWIKENGTRYAIDLVMNQDASFYIDTRYLRSWLKENSKGKTVLNTFAYTGSLGIAALAGGAKQVVQTDLNKRFLNMAKTSCSLNGFPIHKKDFKIGDFWIQTKNLNRAKAVFDIVILDPPFFASTDKGQFDLQLDTKRLINKLRPLVRDGGYIVSINNALYLSGQDYLSELEELCQDGYVAIQEFIAVPDDCRGFSDYEHSLSIANPAPFNHSTKIAILKINPNPK